MQLPSSYKKRNDYGCWGNQDEAWGTNRYRDICVEVRRSSDISHFHLTDIQGTHIEDKGVCVADCTRYEDWRADTVEIGGRPAYVERARASGGFEGLHRQRVVLVIVPFADGRSAVIQGQLGDDAGYPEIVAIARTITERR